MTLYGGQPYKEGDVSLLPPQPLRIFTTFRADDVAKVARQWVRRAEAEDETRYFSVHVGDELAGQVFLHDIDEEKGEALVGYHLFEQRFRGRGVGTMVLKLLQRYVSSETKLNALILITSADNPASCRAAEKAGFTYEGPPRENPAGMILRWNLPNGGSAG